jgi:RimJ/RimL family protein N-acetyltransferase
MTAVEFDPESPALPLSGVIAPRIWRTERLRLRLPAPTDLPFIIDLFSRNELVAHRPDPEPDSAETSLGRLTREIAHWQQHGFGRWAVEADDELIGFGGVTRSPFFAGHNLSYHLHPDFWRLGYATELARFAIDFALNDLGAFRVIGLARNANPASQRVLQKAGLSFESDVILHGKPINLFSRYAED